MGWAAKQALAAEWQGGGQAPHQKCGRPARARTICISMLCRHAYLYASLHRYGPSSHSPPSNHSLRQRIYCIGIIHCIGSDYYCIESFTASTSSTASTASNHSLHLLHLLHQIIHCIYSI